MTSKVIWPGAPYSVAPPHCSEARVETDGRTRPIALHSPLKLSARTRAAELYVRWSGRETAVRRRSSETAATTTGGDRRRSVTTDSRLRAGDDRRRRSSETAAGARRRRRDRRAHASAWTTARWGLGRRHGETDDPTTTWRPLPRT